MDTDIRLGFLKARFEYCKEIFYKMYDDNEKLENKMKLLTSFMVIFLSAIILNISGIEKLKGIISTKSDLSINLILRLDYIFITMLFLYSIFCIFMSLKISFFQEIYPRNFSEKFLFPNTKYFMNEDEEVTGLKDEEILKSFYYTMSKVIINSITTNSNILNRKAKWFQYSLNSLLLSIFMICISLIIVLIK
jgi:hypothetical protein